MKILFAGDYCSQERVAFAIDNNKSDDLFYDLDAIISGYDYAAVNFEFPIVCGRDTPIQKCGPALSGSPQSIDLIKKAGFNICTLANNHILDQGESCLLDTKQKLEEKGFFTVGAGRDINDSSKALCVEKKGERMALINCCEHEFSIATMKSAGANPLNVIMQYKSIRNLKETCDYVIVIVHGGIEHYQYPTYRMKETYRFFVDAGADAVINHHQHCYCGYEIYNGKPIFYGLGNFLFDWEGKRHSIWNTGVMAGISLSKEKTPVIELFPYTQCDDKPGVFLMSDREKTDFMRRSKRINKIIQNDELLNEEFKKYVASKMKDYSLLVEPYDTRLTKGLYYRGLLPSVVSNAKLTKIYDYIYCESHQEVMLAVLKELIRK